MNFNSIDAYFTFLKNQYNNNFDSVAKKVAKAVTNNVNNNLNTLSYNGVKWQSLSQSYKKIKEKAGKGGDANLIYDGQLYSDIQRTLTDGVNNANKRGIQFIFTNKLAEIHNNGTDKIPQRQFIGSDSDLIHSIETLINEELTKILNK